MPTSTKEMMSFKLDPDRDPIEQANELRNLFAECGWGANHSTVIAPDGVEMNLDDFCFGRGGSYAVFKPDKGATVEIAQQLEPLSGKGRKFSDSHKEKIRIAVTRSWRHRKEHWDRRRG
jgi:hypothetical protein